MFGYLFSFRRGASETAGRDQELPGLRRGAAPAIRNPDSLRGGFAVLSRFAYENSRPGGVAVMEIQNGGKQKQRQFVPLVRTELRGEVIGPLASLAVTHVYRYTRQQCDRVLAAAYRFPLPGDAAVTGVRVRFGEVEILAELKGREAAEKEYGEAVEEGRQAALLTRESPDVFTLQVAGLQPDEAVTVETTYVQLARTEGMGWSLRLPLTTAPRYARSDELTGRHAHGQPLVLVSDPGHRFSLNLSILGAGEVTSSTHGLTAAHDGESTHVRLKEGEVVPDRDCVLTWQPRQEAERASLQVWLHDDATTSQAYFLALVAPPASPDPSQAVPRDVVLLVDHSGSMGGAKWEAADWSVKSFLHGLTDRDVFSLGLFHTETRWFTAKPLSATAANVERAIRFLETHTDSGGTELGVALEQALDLPRVAGGCSRHLLVVTDAEVTDAGRLLRLADDEPRQESARRVSVLCIDAAPNSFLAQQLAERGGGVARFLTSDPQEDDVTSALDGILRDWSAPVHTDLGLEIDSAGVEAAGRRVVPGEQPDRSVVDLGDLPAGRPVWVAGRLPRPLGERLVFRLLPQPGAEQALCPAATGAPGHHPALKPLFGARRVNALEFLIHGYHEPDELSEALRRLGYDPDQLLSAGAHGRKVYAENVRAEAETALRALLAQESLDFGLQCSETAFVAVRSEAGKRVEEYVAVANALPAGWSEEFLEAFAGAPAPAFLMSLSAPGPAAPSLCLREAAPAAARTPVHAMRLSSVAKGRQRAPGESSAVLFSGSPRFEAGKALLFDAARPADAKRLPESVTLTRLKVHFPGGAAEAKDLDAQLCLLLYVGDLTLPTVRVRLADLVRLGGKRPLNVTRAPGQPVCLMLEDPAGAWTSGAPELEVVIAW
jgi:Ca-activated chloride channel family protein